MLRPHCKKLFYDVAAVLDCWMMLPASRGNIVDCRLLTADSRQPTCLLQLFMTACIFTAGLRSSSQLFYIKSNKS